MKRNNKRNKLDFDHLEMSAQDLAIIFDSLNIGIRHQRHILEDIWNNDRWVLEKKYNLPNKKLDFYKDVLYQVDYLYNKNDIDDSIRAVIRNAAELGYQVDPGVLVEDELGLSEYFKSIWIQLKYVKLKGMVRIKLRTLLKRYHYKKRSARFCNYVDACLHFYKIGLIVKGVPCDIRDITIDTMITFYLQS